MRPASPPTSRTSEKVSALAEYLRSLTPAELPGAVDLHDRPTLPGAAIRARRASAGRPSLRSPRRSLRRRRARSAWRTTSHPTSVRRSATCSPAHDHVPAAEPPTLAGVDGRLRRDGRGPWATGQGPAACASCSSGATRSTARSIVKILTGELRIGLREGHLEAAIAAAFDRPLGRCPMGGHAHRRPGPDCRAGPRRSPRSGRAGPVPAAQVDARRAGGRRDGSARTARDADLGRGQVRRHPRPAAQARRAWCTSTAAICTMSATATRR